MDIFKDPVTDHGKLSKKGRVTLEQDERGLYATKTQGTGDIDKVTFTALSVCVVILLSGCDGDCL